MPTYDYKCDACGHAFEKFHSIKADPIRKCPACGKNKVNRLIGTGAGLIFKGSGFYITDYRSESYKNAAKSDGQAAASSGTTGSASGNGAATSKSSSSSSSDSKPASGSSAARPSGSSSGPASGK